MTFTSGSPTLVDPLDALLDGPRPDVLRVALAVPTTGPLAMTAPAALGCAVLAAEELGSGERPVELVLVDAGRAPDDVAGEVRGLSDAGLVSGVVGFHTSDVHRRVEQVTAGRLPYVFTPPHEGGRRAAGVVLLGEGPAEQLVPVVTGLAARPSLRRWALVGNDYLWPWAVHAVAAPMLRAAGAEVVLHELVPFGAVDADRLLDLLRRSRSQAVLLSLVGRDLATFNRAFVASGLQESVVRVSGSLEENGLLEAGGDDTGELYAAMRWFASSSGSEDLRGRYAARWGDDAPSLGTYAQGCYEGVHALVGLLAGRRPAQAAAPRPVLLARAEGCDLTVLR